MEDVRSEVAKCDSWYHTLDLPGGVVTPGLFDLRPIVSKLPWPEVGGMRCLDVGTADGFYAFEVERRGAREVLGTDSDTRDWDWPADVRAVGSALHARKYPRTGEAGFEIAKRALASRARRRILNVYDLSPEKVGTFDVVLCGSLMLHLRDPVRALEAIRSVCDGVFLSVETISLVLTILARKRPIVHLNGKGLLQQWWTPNAAGHRQMLSAGGFEVVETTAPFAIPLGVAHPRPKGWAALKAAVRGTLAGGRGVPHVAAVARPRS